MTNKEKVKKEEVKSLLRKIDELNNRSEKVIENTSKLFCFFSRFGIKYKDKIPAYSEYDIPKLSP